MLLPPRSVRATLRGSPRASTPTGLWFYGSFCLYGDYSSTTAVVPLPCNELDRSSRVAEGVDPYGSAETDHNLFREIPLRALPWVGFDFADNT